jgi:NADH-quinone oxidoreductase subunit L
VNFLFENWAVAAAALSAHVPFAAFGCIMLFTRGRPALSAGLSIGAVSLSTAGALFLLVAKWGVSEPGIHTHRWFISGDVSIQFGFLLDPLSVLMLSMVAVVSLLIQVYSLGYMAGDPGFSRYYGFHSLFAGAMLALVVSPNLLQLYVFWELVGLASYLLIGFWYERFSATQAGKKAFVMTRLGDAAMLLGMLILLVNLGNLDITEMNRGDLRPAVTPWLLTLSCLLLFGGIVGKSAQFPLMTWLPDAMEGPTPVSALLHSATMVAAGVFLFARLFGFLSYAAGVTAMTVFLAIGTITMLLAATMAMVTRDIKQVWAYSTVSQLGFMIMGLAAGGYAAGIFHLLTHAGFKALLFLCAGVWVHHFETNDIFEMGEKDARRFKVPAVSIVVACAALAGFPLFSGFYSKEAVMAALGGLENPIWVTAGLIGAFLTAYYAFRVVFVVLITGEGRGGRSSGGHAVEGSGEHVTSTSPSMAWPIMILAAATVVLGFVEPMFDYHLRGGISWTAVQETVRAAWLPYGVVGLSFLGAGLAWFEFGRSGATRLGFVDRMPAVARLFRERWYLDHAYRFIVDRVVDGFFSFLFYGNERKVIDASIDRFCSLTVRGSRRLSFLQSGVLRHNLMAMFGVMLLVGLYLILE